MQCGIMSMSINDIFYLIVIFFSISLICVFFMSSITLLNILNIHQYSNILLSLFTNPNTCTSSELVSIDWLFYSYDSYFFLLLRKSGRQSVIRYQKLCIFSLVDDFIIPINSLEFYPEIQVSYVKEVCSFVSCVFRIR